MDEWVFGHGYSTFSRGIRFKMLGILKNQYLSELGHFSN